jgi:hypothetical protein
MKTIIFILSSLIFFTACNEQQKKKDENIITKRKIDPYLEEIFLKKYANYAVNSLVKTNALKELNKKIDSLYPLKYLEDIPLKIFKIAKNTQGKGAIVQFYTDNDETQSPISNQLNFDIIGLMSEEMASNLKEDSYQKYLIKGHNYIRATQEMADLIVAMTYYSTETSIEKESYGIPKFKVGNFICEIDSLENN